MAFIVVGLICIVLVVLIFKGVSKMEDKAREKDVYYTVVPLFTHLVAPILIPILTLLLAVAVIGIALGLAMMH